MRDDKLLFYKHEWFSVVENQKAQVRKHAGNLTAAAFEKSSVDELAQQLAEKFSLEPPAIFPEQIEVRQREVEIEYGGHHDPYSYRSGARSVRGTAIDVYLPYSGDGAMFDVKPSTFNLNPPRGEVENGAVRFTILGTDLSPENVKAEIDGFVKSVNEYLGYQAGSIGNFTKEIHRIAYEAVEQRKAKLDGDKNLVSQLGYKTRS